MPRKKLKKAKEYTDKKTFFRLLEKSSKPASKECQKGDCHHINY